MRNHLNSNFVNNPLLCVECWTYNHSPFIVDTMNGFCMQQTIFPFVCCIVDDASTDGEPEIIKKYLNTNFEINNSSIARQEETEDYILFFAQHKTNRNCYFAAILLKYNHFGKKSKMPYIYEWVKDAKYIAFCEGDDYWTKSDKLQIQVDYLESHQEYSLTCHRYEVYDYENGIWEKDENDGLFKGLEGLSFGLDYKAWFAKTLTLVIRSSALDEFRRRSTNGRDTVFVYFALKQGKGYCFNKVMGVYRRHQGGICSKKSNYENRMALYNTSKYIYSLDKEINSRKRYYRNYMYALAYTHGRLLFEEKLELRKILSVPVYTIKEVAGWIKYKIVG